MPFSGGVFTRLYSWVTDRNNLIKINAPRMDAEFDGIATALNAIVSQSQAFTGQVKATDGTAALPGYTFDTDTDTGLYRAGANALGFVTGGVEAARIGSAGNFLIGSANAITGLGGARLTSQGITSATSTISTGLFVNATTGPAFSLAKSRAATVDTYTIVQNADTLGILDFWGADGSQMVRGAQIRGYVIGTPAAGDVRGGLQFYTGSGAGVTANRLGIDDTSITATLPILVPNGTAAAPSIAFANSATTGFFRGTADAIGISIGGTERHRFTSTDLLRLGNASTDIASIAARLQLQGTSIASSSAALFQASANTNAPQVMLGKSRGAAVGDYTIINSGDNIGVISFRGADGTTLIQHSANIISTAQGTPAAGDVRGDLRFSTGSGAATVTEALRIGTDQTVLALAAGLGYGTGAGGTVTQVTSRTTGVTINKPCGNITMFTAAGSATPASFTVTNSMVGANDVVSVCIKSGATNVYNLAVTAVAAGSFVVTFWTTGGTASDTPVLNFNVHKGVNA